MYIFLFGFFLFFLITRFRGRGRAVSRFRFCFDDACNCRRIDFEIFFFTLSYWSAPTSESDCPKDFPSIIFEAVSPAALMAFFPINFAAGLANLRALFSIELKAP